MGVAAADHLGSPPRSASASRPRPAGEGATAAASDRARSGSAAGSRAGARGRSEARRGEGCGAGWGSPPPDSRGEAGRRAAAPGRWSLRRGALDPRQDEPQCHLRQSEAAETCAENVSGPAGREGREAGRERPASRRLAVLPRTAPWRPGGGGRWRGAVQGRPGEGVPRGAGRIFIGFSFFFFTGGGGGGCRAAEDRGGGSAARRSQLT